MNEETPSKGAMRKRKERLEKGRRSEAAAKAWSRTASLQSLIEEPLLETIAELGGSATPGQVYGRIADRLGLDQAALEESRTAGDGQTYMVYQQQVRWARQTAIVNGLLDGSQRGVWSLTAKGEERLAKAEDGAVVLVYRLDDGFAFWARAEDAAGVITPGSIRLVNTSPPYPGIDREYGKLGVAEWLGWMTRLAAAWRELIDDEGTIAINLGDVHVPGTPALSPYVERFVLAAIDNVGLHLAGRAMWHSPSKLGHIEWASKRRCQLANRLEHVVLLSRTPFPAWDTRRLPSTSPAPRSEAKRANDAKRLVERRPTGKLLRPGAFASGTGLPGNLITVGGASGGDAYSRACRAAGETAHPARFPEALPRWTIALATSPGDCVYDPMCGSNTTGKVALDMGRRFIASDATLGYVVGSAARFQGRNDLRILTR